MFVFLVAITVFGAAHASFLRQHSHVSLLSDLKNLSISALKSPKVKRFSLMTLIREHSKIMSNTDAEMQSSTVSGTSYKTGFVESFNYPSMTACAGSAKMTYLGIGVCQAQVDDSSPGSSMIQKVTYATFGESYMKIAIYSDANCQEISTVYKFLFYANVCMKRAAFPAWSIGSRVSKIPDFSQIGYLQQTFGSVADCQNGANPLYTYFTPANACMLDSQYVTNSEKGHWVHLGSKLLSIQASSAWNSNGYTVETANYPLPSSTCSGSTTSVWNYYPTCVLSGGEISSITVTGGNSFFSPAPTAAPVAVANTPSASPTLAPISSTTTLNTGYILTTTYASATCSGTVFTYQAYALGVCQSGIMYSDYIVSTGAYTVSTYTTVGCTGTPESTESLNIYECSAYNYGIQTSQVQVYSTVLPAISASGYLQTTSTTLNSCMDNINPSSVYFAVVGVCIPNAAYSILYPSCGSSVQYQYFTTPTCTGTPQTMFSNSMAICVDDLEYSSTGVMTNSYFSEMCTSA